MKYVFEVVKITAWKRGKCKCGKYLARQKRFDQTINPFNKNKFDVPKSRQEIYEELNDAATKWRILPVTCKDCMVK